MFKHPFSFEGRIRRTEYGLTLLIYMVFAVLISLINLSVLSVRDSSTTAVVCIMYIPVLWFMWAQGAKRCHDRNNSGWFQLIPFYSLWMLFAEGDRGENTYGHDPKGRVNHYTDSNILDTPETF